MTTGRYLSDGEAPEDDILLPEKISVKYFVIGISFCLVVWMSAFMLMLE